MSHLCIRFGIELKPLPTRRYQYYSEAVPYLLEPFMRFLQQIHDIPVNLSAKEQARWKVHPARHYMIYVSTEA